jgi:peptidoglycan/xylan/chitin deacetylase (PgdA/CDA1 family)
VERQNKNGGLIMLSIRFRKIITAIVIIIFLFIFPATCDKSENEIPDQPEIDKAPGGSDKSDKEESKGKVTEGEGDNNRKDIDLAEVKPNEAGKVMIIMYHDISDREGEWSRHYENFRKDLEIFYQKGYRLISLKDFLDNNIDIPAGFSPIIFTFDDGTKGQFNLIEKDGELVIDPVCAVGILEEFNKKYPDFGMAATFYVYYPIPFRQKEYIGQKFEYLIKNGMDIGNHTYSHANLKGISRQEIQKEIGLHIKKTMGYLKDYNVDTLALPYGSYSKDNYEVIISGRYDDIEYFNRAILMVGAEPALSPVHKRFDPHRLPRIRGSQVYIDRWLKHFDDNPHERYISDGDLNTITVPKEMEKSINPEALNGKELKVY